MGFSCGSTGIAFLIGITPVVCSDDSPPDFATVADGRSTARAEPEPNELVVPIGVGAAGLSFIALSIFSLLAASFSGSAGGSGFKVGLSELYGSMSANNVGLLRMTGVTSLRSTARAACG